MVPWLQFLLFLAAQPGPLAPTHKIDIRIAGPLAMAEVWRSVDPSPRPLGNRQGESTLDLSLPDGAALVDWEVQERRERVRLAPQSEGQVSAGLAAALKMRHLSPSAAPVEEGSRYRIHLTPLAEATAAVLHYRFSAPVACSDGKLMVRMPESLEDNPIPAEVTVTIDALPEGIPLVQASLAGKPAELRPGSRRLVMRGLSPAHAGWDVSWSYRKAASAFPGQALVATGPLPNESRAKGSAQAAVAATLCLAQAGADAPAPQASPDSVVLLVDRSRSVGQGGLSQDRLVGRALIEALPPSVPFNAILFGQSATPLFPLARLPTREALEALSSALDPNQLERKTDVVAALARARESYLPVSSAPAWMVVVTDGALPPDQTAERMQAALGGKGPAKLRVLVLLVRQRGDDPVSEAALAEYARLVAGFGGLVREVPAGSENDAARAIIRSMGMGGDWFGLRVDGQKLAEVLAVGQGATRVFPSRPAHTVRLTARGVAAGAGAAAAALQLKLAALPVKGEWLAPLLPAASDSRRAWAGATGTLAVAVLPASPVAKKTDDVVHGRIDETVLRNALSLAFMPRARACYLSRRVATANDAFLRGRVRLELTIERGELHDAVVRKSTLGNPDIEACLRNAAWAVDYPRPEHRDALTIANLNLVFRPRTPEDSGRPDASAVDREIELVLGPLTFTTDFSDLLETAPADKAAGP